MQHRFSTWSGHLVAPMLLVFFAACGGPEKAIEEKLNTHVIFYSNFERGVDALACAGSTLAEIDGKNTRHILSEGAPNGGDDDGYISFNGEAKDLSYKAKMNFPYGENGFSGAVVFWTSVDMDEDLKADFPEPFHIGKQQSADGKPFPWDDAVLFLDFTKPPRKLRFGAYPNKKEGISDAMVEERVIQVSGVTWKSDEWHHIVLTWSNFNSGKADAEWALFVDGKEMGRKRNLKQDVSWNMATQVIRFNHYKYPGKIDEIAIFDTMLDAADASYFLNPKKPLNRLLKKDYPK